MPELPEVQTVVSTLQPRVVGKTIRGVRLLRSDIVTPPDADLASHLTGRRIRSVERRGKRIVFTLGSGERFYIHLGMTGQLTVVPRGAAPARVHTHLEIDLGKTSIRFRDPRRFGGVWWLGGECCDEGMGPEPLRIRPSQLARRLAKTRRAVKCALLDQAVVAGLGNIYVDEALFAARIHPLTPANQLSLVQVNRLNRAIKTTLRRALRHRGSSVRDYVDVDGRQGGFQKLHRVYDRKGRPCTACRTAIECIRLGGRSTHFCPRCQAETANRGACESIPSQPVKRKSRATAG